MESTVSNNIATGESTAGGIDFFRGNLRVIDSTISGNSSTSAVSGVGGMYVISEPGSSSYISGTTIAYNSSNGTSVPTAGGIVAYGGVGTRSDNTIIARNNGVNPDFDGNVSGRNNVVGINSEAA